MRTDPDGKRALFTHRRQPSPAESGRRALFSSRPDLPAGRVSVECSRCGSTSRVSAWDAASRLARFSLWIPGRSYSRRLRCPACHRRCWVRLRMV